MTELSIPMHLCAAACDVLKTANATEKVEKTFQYVQAWKDGSINEVGHQTPPDHPARPQKPDILNPRDMPRRRLGSESGRIALIHSIAHIELNAIDIAWDIMARFEYENLPKSFFDDWVQVAYDEAVHFQLLNDRLADFDTTYGDLPAHAGLWDAAFKSRHDLMARCALVPMVLEPRGLDTTPPTVEKLRRMGDEKTAAILERIGVEEIPHVAAGTRWFNHMAQRRNVDPIATYHNLIRSLFNTKLKGPFNKQARDQAGLTPDYYEPLSKEAGAA